MAGANTSGLPQRGKVYLTGPSRTAPTTYAQSQSLEGFVKEFEDLDYAASSTGVKGAPRSSYKVECMLVRNAATIALQPKRLVKWKSGKRFKQVDGYCTVDFEECAGVVDEWLPAAGVAINDLFWITRKGPTLCLTDLAGGATNVIAASDMMLALTAATSQATTAGRVQAFAATSNLTNAVSMIFNKLGRAMSAKTTANTNAGVLVNMELVP